MTAPCPTFGFVVDVGLAPNVSAARQHELWQAFCDTVEGRALVLARVNVGSWPAILKSEASQATDADRQAIQAWAATRREIVRLDVGQLVDLSAD